MKRNFHLSLKKGCALSVAGVVSALSYGVYAMMSENVSQDNLSSLSTISNPETKEIENTQVQNSEQGLESIENKVETPSKSIDSPTPEKLMSGAPAKVEDKKDEKDYTVDEDWFKGVGKHSMAYKYKDSLVLVKADNPIGKEKADMLQKIVKENSGTVFYSYGYGYWDVKDITPTSVHKLCTWALSYSEGTTFGSLGTRLSKHYFDLIWKTCGRDNAEKPAGWWYR